MTRALRGRRAAEPDPYSFGQRPYDLVKEFVAALVVVTVLTAALAAVFSSPDDPAVTIAHWAKAAPADFTATALAELDGSSGTAQYGPPYNSAAIGQKLGPLELQKLGGVRHRIDTAADFVLTPLAESAPAPSCGRSAGELHGCQLGTADEVDALRTRTRWPRRRAGARPRCARAPTVRFRPSSPHC